MPRFYIKITADIEKEALPRFLSDIYALGASVVSIRDDVSYDKPVRTDGFSDGFAARRARTSERNAEIIAKYEADPQKNSTPKLAEEYGVSRERICQILRPVNVIGMAQERRAAAKAALAGATEALKKQTEEEWAAKFEEALVHVRAGKSCRQAADAVGLPKHSNFVNLLSKKAKLLRIKPKYGRWRDFSARKRKCQALFDQGLNPAEVTKKLRATTEPKIHYGWVCKNFPQYVTRKLTKNEAPSV